MGKLFIVYASLTGNTEEIAELIAEGAGENAGEVKLVSCKDMNSTEILEHDGVLMGLYTWGDGEVPDEFINLYEELDGMNLTGIQAAVFGSGDLAYAQFCGAVDLVERKLRERGASIVQESLKIEFHPEGEEKERCRQFGRRAAELLAGVD
ncbi:flavodoxin [Paenibacillus sp. JX-17]|uniref:Flavodoxin n=1 Tax=Paenibacillus lacisoli TaxID=3064525 RepID=A0ABT9C6W9_9BACL|nr:flavodoxin [Paenibacillus sp. JX-17]MDO7904981.1 flavodoxin [Paenibacillus sp. JX-17]